jgi:hypothetical protein
VPSCKPSSWIPKLMLRLEGLPWATPQVDEHVGATQWHCYLLTELMIIGRWLIHLGEGSVL